MTHEIALIPGDGIGLEVIPEGVRTLKALAGKFGFEVSFSEFPLFLRLLPGARPDDAGRRFKAINAL